MQLNIKSQHRHQAGKKIHHKISNHVFADNTLEKQDAQLFINKVAIRIVSTNTKITSTTESQSEKKNSCNNAATGAVTRFWDNEHANWTVTFLLER